MVKGEHRRVENIEDFTQWDWGPPEHLAKPLDELKRAIVEWMEEWSEDNIVSEAHEKSCASGAAVAFEELAKNGFFFLDAITDKGLLISFQGTVNFCIYDELDIVEHALNSDNPEDLSAHLRRLADAIDAASTIAPAPPAVTPLIRAAALEEAAVVAEARQRLYDEPRARTTIRETAAAIRALISTSQPPSADGA
jgi:hypothetical protein